MFKRTGLAAAAAASLAFPASAQIQAGNLVNVNVGPVLLNRILSNNNIDVQAIAPITVQLPISAAANGRSRSGAPSASTQGASGPRPSLRKARPLLKF